MDLRHLDERERTARIAAFGARATLAHIIAMIERGDLAHVGPAMTRCAIHDLERIQNEADEALSVLFAKEEVSA